jgi:glycosyltransferase involved in cell wall biosynthesis
MMRVLFVHQNFPGQYRHLAPALAARGDEVVGLGENAARPLPGVRHLRYRAPAKGRKETHRYLQRLENATYRGQQVVRAALQLRAEGWRPDIVCCHPGWGEGLFLRDVWPDTKLLYYYEYYYQRDGGDVSFDLPGREISLDDACRVRLLNANHLLCLQQSDWGHTATAWQASRFPDWARAKLSVIHEGIDTDTICPAASPSVALPDGRVLRRGDEVITFVSRGLEPYRGFPAFMRALPEILAARPAAQILVVGGDEPHYGSPPPNGGTWKQALLSELGQRLDRRRVHFTGRINHTALQSVLGVSAAHIYLTYPFVLSWSMLEAMAQQCLVIGSATPPVEEVIRHGENGLLVDFFSPDAIAKAAISALSHPSSYSPLRAAARNTIVERYDLRRRCLLELIQLIDDVVAGRRAKQTG